MDRYCRTCYRTNGARMFDINAISQVTNVRIGDMVIYCLQIEISPYDLLPQKICETCLCSLNAMFMFRKHCYYSETELRKMLKYAPPEHIAIATPNMEQELDLVDALMPVQNEPIKKTASTHNDKPIIKIDSSPENLASSSTSNHHSPEIDNQNILPTAETPLIDDNLPEKPIVVERYNQKLFECEQCDYRSSFKCNVLRHQQCRDHSGLRITIPKDKAPLKAVKKLQCCGECGFQTFIRSNLLRHQRVWKHSTYSTRDVEVKRVLEKCPSCPYCGVQRANLQAHMAQWCRVLRGKKEQRRAASAVVSDENTLAEEAPPIVLKFEVENNDDM